MSSRSRLSSERGAILVHVAVASIALIAFSMFVIDYGILWVSRNQAQNAADAGALAGAVAMAFDGDDGTNTGPAKQSAREVALRNLAFGEAPDVQIVDGGPMDVLFYDEDPTKFPAECADGTCIRVDVYRNQARANPLPMMFGQLVGLTDQGVRATATARAVAGNAADCVKPWVIADRWDENADPNDLSTWTQSSEFNDALVPDTGDGVNDVYVPPSFDADGNFISGTGFGRTLDDGVTLADYGYQFVLRMANPGGQSPLGVRSPGWVMTVELPASNAGQQGVLDNISGCTDATVAIADPANPCDEPSSTEPDEEGRIVVSCLPVQPGNAWNPQEGALADLIGDDVEDVWLPASADCPNGCPSNGGSNRIIPLALFDPAHYHASGATGSTGVAKIVNILGFFVEGTCGGGTPIDPETAFAKEGYLQCTNQGPANDLVGRLVTIPGEMTGGSGGAGGGFTQVIRLIR